MNVNVQDTARPRFTGAAGLAATIGSHGSQVSDVGLIPDFFKS
jgi:hypothetical protein